MKHILVLGATGHLGTVLTQLLLEKGYKVTVLVRNPHKLTIENKNITTIVGSVISEEDLKNALDNVDAVISVLGHGFRTPFPIQEKTLNILLPLMEKKHISRFITVSGAGLIVNGDPKSFIATISSLIFPIIDPYRLSDAKAQQLLLEKSSVKWTVVRTPIHNNKTNQKIRYIGFNQPMPWDTLSRKAICEFVLECLEENKWVNKSPIIY